MSSEALGLCSTVLQNLNDPRTLSRPAEPCLLLRPPHPLTLDARWEDPERPALARTHAGPWEHRQEESHHG